MEWPGTQRMIPYLHLVQTTTPFEYGKHHIGGLPQIRRLHAGFSGEIIRHSIRTALQPSPLPDQADSLHTNLHFFSPCSFAHLTHTFTTTTQTITSSIVIIDLCMYYHLFHIDPITNTYVSVLNRLGITISFKFIAKARCKVSAVARRN